MRRTKTVPRRDSKLRGHSSLMSARKSQVTHPHPPSFAFCQESLAVRSNPFLLQYGEKHCRSRVPCPKSQHKNLARGLPLECSTLITKLSHLLHTIDLKENFQKIDMKKLSIKCPKCYALHWFCIMFFCDWSRKHTPTS